jgi:hypothetical protein
MLNNSPIKYKYLLKRIPIGLNEFAQAVCMYSKNVPALLVDRIFSVISLQLG